jgi:predicted  nucleic acid-binding Zn-ribbon protein
MKTPQTRLASPELVRLERQELAVSQRRRQLHKEIDRLYLSAPLTDEQTKLLDELEQLEHDVSSERRRLHRRIDEERKQAGLPTWREQHEAHSDYPTITWTRTPTAPF